MGISVAHTQSGYSFTASRLNWNLEVLVFVERGKPENPEKNPRSKDENQQQAKPTYDPGPHWWELSPLHHPCSPIFYLE